MPEEGARDGPLGAGEGPAPQLQRRQSQEGRRASPISFELHPRAARAEVHEGAQEGEQGGDLRFPNLRVEVRPRAVIHPEWLEEGAPDLPLPSLGPAAVTEASLRKS